MGAKQLQMLPHRLAIALQEDGWIVRADCVWHKASPLPESVRDRPTRAHEYVFLLARSRRYFYDAEAVREPYATAPVDRDRAHVTGRGGQAYSAVQPGVPGRDKCGGYPFLGSGRNLRSVWKIASQPSLVDHFARFPEALVQPLILAGTSAWGVCAACGAPWRRVVELREPLVAQQRACGGDAEGEYHGEGRKQYEASGVQNASEVKARILLGLRERVTAGWGATCRCGTSEVRPALVLDPFVGTGTVVAVAVELGRSGIGIDLNAGYCQLARRRVAQVQPALPGWFGE